MNKYRETVVKVTNEKLLSAGKSLLHEEFENVVCVNFHFTKNHGGGFINDVDV